MSSQSSNTGYLEVTSTAIPQVTKVRFYEDAWEHTLEGHPEVESFGRETILSAVNAPSKVYLSTTSPDDSFVFVSDDICYEGYPLHVPVKVVVETSARVRTAFFSDRTHSKVIWDRNNLSEKERVRYDKNSDVLYISVNPGKHGIAEETLPGVLWRYGIEHRDIVGVTIMDFSQYWGSRLDELEYDLVSHLDISSEKAKSLLQIGG